MFRYLKAAFFERVPLPGLGSFPVNAVLTAGVVILGFGHPAFWLLGFAIETAYLFGLATNRRYQQLVDARALVTRSDNAKAGQQAQVSQLRHPQTERLRTLEAKCRRAIDLARVQQHEDFLIDNNREALAKLSHLYLRLLLARQLLLSSQTPMAETQLRTQIAALQQEITSPELPSSLRESKSATLEILERRLHNLQRREQSLAEIDSDLTRIEAQVDLAVDNAGINGQPQAVSANISLVSQLLDPDLQGMSLSTTDDFDSAADAPAMRQKEGPL
ncbi:MAG TPA: hypothetical protein VGB55_12945 [Tepidisphaeraceae bacterium]|jgi:hypothetical protein